MVRTGVSGFGGASNLSHTTSEVSLLLPTYNEAASILRLLQEIDDVLRGAGIAYEALILDDASPDGTADLVEQHYPPPSAVRVIRRSGPRGLAIAIREGIERAGSATIIAMDSDFNHDPQALPRLLASLEHCDLAAGSRFIRGGGMYSRTRWLGSLVMNWMIRSLLRTGVHDNLSGYFAMRHSDLARLPADEIFAGYGDYYVRLLWHARHLGLHIVEVPVFYRSREGGSSKTPLLRTSWRYTRETLRFRARIAARRD